MEEESVPRCIGIIPDGNRRWAKEKSLLKLEGHRAGYNKFKEVIKWAFEAGVKTVFFYAFSSENWSRESGEVDYLMRLLKWALANDLEELHGENIRIRVVGDREKLPNEFRSLIADAEKKTENNLKGTVAILLSYGGRGEIVAAVKRALAGGADPASISEDNFKKYFWSSDLPDPDLVIRTSGEQRLSNFLTWQTAYSEFFFPRTYWPDFSKAEFDKILSEFAVRERRFGK